MNQFLRLSLLVGSLVSLSSADFSRPAGTLPIRVRDLRSHNPIYNAKICIGDDSLCVFSDSSGIAVFDSLIPDIYTITVFAEGYTSYKEWNIKVKQGVNYELLFDLSRNAITDLDKLTVHSTRKTLTSPSQSTSATRYSNFDLSHTAGTADDISRVLSTNPGVMTTPGVTDDNTLYVRGGGANENVFIIDGIELDNANHFSDVNTSGGAMSFLSGALVRELDFYTGGFPAMYPPRLSAVIDMKLRTGSFSEYSFEADANIAGLGFTAEGPLSESCSFLTSVRMVNLNLLDRFLELEGIPRFGDALMKFVATPTSEHTIKITGIGAIDNYHEKYDINDYRFPTSYDEWIYQAGGIIDWEFRNSTFAHSISMSVTGRKEFRHDDAVYESDATQPDTFIINLTEYHRSKNITDSLFFPDDTLLFQYFSYNNSRLWGEDDRRWNMKIKDNVTLFLRENDELHAGLEATAHRYYICNEDASEYKSFLLFTHDNEQRIQPDAFYLYTRADSSMEIRHAGGYVEYVFTEGRLKAVAGLRGDYYNVITDYGISPRIGLQLNLGDKGIFAASGGVYYQFPSDFSGMIGDILTAYSNSAYANVPLNDILLQRSWQGVVRYEKEVGASHNLTLEAYGKWYDREYPFASPSGRLYYESTDHGFIWLLDKANGKKRAYGVEILFRKNSQNNFYYSCSYSLFRVQNRYVNNNWYNDKNNTSGMLGLTIGRNFTRNHGLSFRVIATGGRPYSPVRKSNTTNRYEYDTTKAFYSEILDPVISANIRYQFTANRKWGSITGYIELWNLLDQKPIAQRWLNPYSKNGYSELQLNGLLPVAGIKISF